MHTFGYERPETLAQAVAILDRHGPQARLLAGGTDLIIALRDGRIRPAVLVDAKRIPELRPAITESAGLLSISADTVMTDIAGDPRVRGHFPALAEAAAAIGAVQIRNRATLAGNICNASPAADTAPPLLAYAAQVVAARARRHPPHPGRPTSSWAQARRRCDAESSSPASRSRYRHGPAGSAFGRLTRRKGADLATISVSASIDGAGRTRLGFGAVGPRPLLAADDSGVLADPAAHPGERAALLATLARTARPISDVRASREYRMSMLPVLSQRVLDIAVTRRAKGGR